MKKAYLVLANGDVYEGESFGADIDAVGELVFTTGVVGYIETLTDPSYAGQIVMQTFPLIGNYGIIEEDFVGVPALNGYVVREWCDVPSNFRSQYGLDEFLKKHGIPAICGVDTREITRTIRECGVMNAMICSEVPEDIGVIKNFVVKDAVKSVSPREEQNYPACGEEKYRVVMYDCGAKNAIIEDLTKRGCTVCSVPFDTAAARVLELHPDGVVISDGPGDPAENEGLTAEIKKLAGKVPMFGFGLGHQMIALAMGGKTVKLKYGHRGANQPVYDTKCGRTYITGQNHGYAVEAESLAGVGEQSFYNVNDGTCEGMVYADKKAFSVQFYPQTCKGPQDMSHLFDEFVQMMGGAQ